MQTQKKKVQSWQIWKNVPFYCTDMSTQSFILRQISKNIWNLIGQNLPKSVCFVIFCISYSAFLHGCVFVVVEDEEVEGPPSWTILFFIGFIIFYCFWQRCYESASIMHRPFDNIPWVTPNKSSNRNSFLVLLLHQPLC